jgi:hypothetical protein
MWARSVPRKSVLLFSANKVPTTLDNSARFFHTDKRHRVF